MSALLSFVVMVRTYGEFDSSFSVGFFVEKGLVFSSLWPLVGADSGFVVLEGKRLRVAEVEALDIDLGFCLLRVEGAPKEEMPPIAEPVLGDSVRVLGIPWDQDRLSDVPAKILGRYEFGGVQQFHLDTVLKLNHDGAPVLDWEGRLVGVVGVALGASRAMRGPEVVDRLLKRRGKPLSFREAVDSLRNTPYWHLIAALSDSDTSRILEEYEKAKPLPAAYLYRSATLVGMRKLRAALVEVKAALRLEPFWSDALYNTAVLQKAFMKYEEAEANFRRLLEICPTRDVRKELEEIEAKRRETTDR